MLNNMDNEHIMFQQLVLLPSVDPSLLQSDMMTWAKGCRVWWIVWKTPVSDDSQLCMYTIVYEYINIYQQHHFFDKEHQYINQVWGIQLVLLLHLHHHDFLWLHSLGMANHFPTMSTSEFLRVEDHPRFYKKKRFFIRYLSTYPHFIVGCTMLYPNPNP